MSIGMPGSLGAQDVSLSLGTWGIPEADPGIFALAGLNLGLGPRLEAGISAAGRLNPDPLSEIYAEARLGYSLLSDRASPSGGATGFFNLVAEAGFIQELPSSFTLAGAWGKAESERWGRRLVYLRLSPAIGNPYYRRRDRIVAPSLIYDIDEGKVSFSLSLLISDFYIVYRAGSR